MADTNPANLINSDADLTPEELEELRRLSPAGVLAKPPAAPSNIQQLPSREELIQQAAKAPATSFAVPALEQIPPSSSSANPVAPSPLSPASPIPTTPPPAPRAPATPPIPPSASLPINQVKSVDISTPSKPVQQTSIKTTPQTEVLSPERAAMSVRPAVLGKTTLERASLQKRFALFGVLGALLLGFILLAVLGFTGTRVPVMYSIFHGISTNGVTLASNAKVQVLAYENYSATGEINLTENGSSNQAPSAPSPTISATAYSATSPNASVSPVISPSPSVSPVGSSSATSSLVTKYEQLSFEETEGRVTGKGSFTANKSTSAVSFTLRAPQEGAWILRSSGESTAFSAANGTDIRRTLLSAAIEPIAIGNMLAAAGSELSYKMVSDASGKYAQYIYQVLSPSLAAYLPEGMTITDKSQLLVWYATSQVTGREPGTVTALRLILDANYLGKSYSIVQTVIPAAFGETALATSRALDEQLLGTVAETPEAVTVEVFANIYGLFLETLPNTLSGSAADGAIPDVSVAPSPSPTETVSPTSAVSPSPSPSISPSPSPTATPYPDSITSPLSAVSLPAPTPGVNPTNAQSHDEKRVSDLQKIASALRTYNSIHGTYPVANTEIQLQTSNSVFQALVPSILGSMPIDPLADIYYYGYRSNGSWYVLTAISESGSSSLGAIRGASYSFFRLSE